MRPLSPNSPLRRLLARPAVLLVTTFASFILLGTVALRLPPCHAARTVGWLDAFFTATSAVCVTGLITVDTATAYSRGGQTVIMVLIQLGGLGVMTFSALAARILGRRVSLGSQAALSEVYFQGSSRMSLGQALRRIVALTFLIEALGAVLLHHGLTAHHPPAGRWYEAAFLAVSSFCNAGFSIYSDNVMGLRDSQVVVWTLMALIVLGGLGYTVLFELGSRAWRLARSRRAHSVVWSLNSRMVLFTSGLLTFAGALALFVAGGHSDGDALPSRALHALFQSVTTRTAGFNTIDIGALPLTALMILMPLMFVGGSPGSCAGGVKTTSITVWVSRVVARLRGLDDVQFWGRRIPHDIVRRAALVVALAALWNMTGIYILTLAGHARGNFGLADVMFEQLSAFGTVGLSTGLTPHLSVVGKLWIIASMFAGRLGPLTMALAVLPGGRQRYRYPAERVMIG